MNYFWKIIGMRLSAVPAKGVFIGGFIGSFVSFFCFIGGFVVTQKFTGDTKKSHKRYFRRYWFIWFIWLSLGLMILTDDDDLIRGYKNLRMRAKKLRGRQQK